MQTPSNNYIKAVNIEGLWDKYDLQWEFHPDVNILAGGNGMGKSTVLRLLQDYLSLMLTTSETSEIKEKGLKKARKVRSWLHEIEISFNNELNFKVRNEIKNKVKGEYWANIVHDARFLKEKLSHSFLFLFSIDTPLNTLEAVQKLSDNRVKTDLDWKLHQAQLNYINYQLDRGRERDILIDEGLEKNREKIEELRKPQLLLFDIINDLFSETGKSIDKNKNEMSFLQDGKEIDAYKLSSGEKHLLVILLSVVCMNQQPAILILDEPEISLHIDWQKKLIGLIRQLNPNVQIILATHSPAIIMDGWMDKVFNIQDLMTPTKA